VQRRSQFSMRSSFSRLSAVGNRPLADIGRPGNCGIGRIKLAGPEVQVIENQGMQHLQAGMTAMHNDTNTGYRAAVSFPRVVVAGSLQRQRSYHIETKISLGLYRAKFGVCRATRGYPLESTVRELIIEPNSLRIAVARQTPNCGAVIRLPPWPLWEKSIT
jgi:hypothetical protein